MIDKHILTMTDLFGDKLILVETEGRINFEITDELAYQVEFSRKDARRIAKAILKATKRKGHK